MNLLHDKQLDLATANSRKAKVWRNKTLPWSDVLERLSRTTRTAETMAEYRKMTKDRQSEIKDVGGFVGGYCNNGKRSDVRFRSIVCLDADFADDALWPDWLAYYGKAAAVYSTHKHTTKKPRLRLVVPLARNVEPDEYQAVSRRIAERLGIEKFDDSTYQPQRIMYWPSTSEDGEFVFEYHDSEFLNPDELLSTYVDWKDISAWPMSNRVTEVVRREAVQQADPTTKPGVVGAFCRAYTIEDAIAKFVPSYEQAEEGRYTYTEGSTASGVLTFHNKFAYSFHATDPASGQLCNAFDLVRIHSFGSSDTELESKATDRPSYKAMMDFALADPSVKAQLVSDAAADFDDVQDTEWTAKLVFDKNGNLSPTIDNIVLVLENDPRLAGCIGYDEMEHTVSAIALPPWRESTGTWSDSDDSFLRHLLEKSYGVSSRDKIFDAVQIVAMNHKFHPVRDYLDTCEWDGLARLDTLLVDYLGAEDTPYTRAVTRKTLAAAVARVLDPGCKFDYMLTLRGCQGLGKSRLLRRLGVDWFSDSFSSVQGKESYEQNQGVWIFEVGELAGLKKAEAENIKLFISKQVDRFRPAYGRRTQEFPRQCIFIGTTNEQQFLRDATGNRRFWVVDTPNAPRYRLDDFTDDEVRQVWAEALLRYRAGEQLYLTDELEAVARRTQSEYEEDDPKTGLIMDYLDRRLPEDWYDKDICDRRQWLESPSTGVTLRDKVTVVEIWCEALGKSPDRMDRYGVKEIADIMAKAEGWVRVLDGKITVRPYGRQRYYRRK